METAKPNTIPNNELEINNPIKIPIKLIEVKSKTIFNPNFSCPDALRNNIGILEKIKKNSKTENHFT